MTPQQQAQEYAKGKYPANVMYPEWQPIASAFLAGHAAGVQAEQQRIWAEINKRVVEDGFIETRDNTLYKIIFGEDK